MKKSIKTFKQISILILAITLLGCEDDAVLPKVVAGFTHTIDAETGTVTFINISTKATNYSWDFGDGTSSTLIDPVKTYPSGTYTIVLKASNVAGASSSYEDTITINIPLGITLPVTFDTANVAYKVATFNGVSFAIVDNPAVSGTNNKASKVGAITNSGKAFEGINFDLSAQVDLTANKTIKMNVWANAPVSVLLKLEKGTGADVEATTNHGGTGWESMSFNFTSSSKYTRLTLFVDGPGTKTGTFYFDDIEQIETPLPPCTPETAQSLLAPDFNLTFQTDPSASIVKDGGDFEWVTNPDISSALNTSCKVGKIVRSASLQYANTQINVASAFDFTTKSGFKMKVWSPAIGTKVTVKLEGGVVTEVLKTTTKANEWEELTFDFAGSATGNNKIVLFFNIDSFTTGTFYIDDFKLYGTGSGGGGTCTADAAESLNAADFNLTFNTNNVAVIQDGATYFRIANPKTDAVNGSCFVGSAINTNTNPWDNVQINLASKLDFNANAGFKMKVYSLKAGTKVTMKLEEIGAAGNNSGDVAVTRTKTGEWEELTFPFPATASGKFNKIVLFFDLESKNGDTYYFDDLKLYARSGGGGGGGGGTCTAPSGDFIADGGFEANAGCWQLINNGGLVSISTTINNGGSNSGQIKTAPLKNPALKQERFGVGVIQPNTKYVVKFDIKANAADMPADGAVFQVFAFSEPAEGSIDPATQHILNAGNANFPTNWETRSYTFTTASKVDGGVSILLELVCGGGSCRGTVNIDNVSLKLAP
ncbi:PKD domain-containing protein [Mariniflexile sp.]|uniref:PKD domain-containing protein n=1 Tax=Mariniflexile sp. TaxID=1979402 RepID=UPI004048D888